MEEKSPIHESIDTRESTNQGYNVNITGCTIYTATSPDRDDFWSKINMAFKTGAFSVECWLKRLFMCMETITTHGYIATSPEHATMTTVCVYTLATEQD